MDCQDTMAFLDDEELLRAALDEESLSEERRKHLDQCAICQQKVVAYKKMHAFLVTKLYRRQCPSSSVLSDYCAGLGTETRGAEIKAHLRECPLCAQEVADTRRFLSSIDSIV